MASTARCTRFCGTSRAMVIAPPSPSVQGHPVVSTGIGWTYSLGM